MPRLRVLSGAEIVKILEANGFVRVRQSGSHVVVRRQTDAGAVSVPVPLHNPVKIGTLGGIIRQSQLARSLLES